MIGPGRRPSRRPLRGLLRVTDHCFVPVFGLSSVLDASGIGAWSRLILLVPIVPPAAHVALHRHPGAVFSQ
jgi:hypothetical protein